MAKVLDKGRVEFAEFMLLKFFAMCAAVDDWYEIGDIFYVLKGSGVHRAEAKEARKRLGVLSEEREGIGRCWKWGNERQPKEILDERGLHGAW